MDSLRHLDLKGSWAVYDALLAAKMFDYQSVYGLWIQVHLLIGGANTSDDLSWPLELGDLLHQLVEKFHVVCL